MEKKVKTQLDDENLKLDSKFVRAIYHFLETHISKVNIRMCPKDVDSNILKDIPKDNKRAKEIINEIKILDEEI